MNRGQVTGRGSYSYIRRVLVLGQTTGVGDRVTSRVPCELTRQRRRVFGPREKETPLKRTYLSSTATAGPLPSGPRATPKSTVVLDASPSPPLVRLPLRPRSRGDGPKGLSRLGDPVWVVSVVEGTPVPQPRELVREGEGEGRGTLVKGDHFRPSLPSFATPSFFSRTYGPMCPPHVFPLSDPPPVAWLTLRRTLEDPPSHFRGTDSSSGGTTSRDPQRRD